TWPIGREHLYAVHQGVHAAPLQLAVELCLKRLRVGAAERDVAVVALKTGLERDVVEPLSRGACVDDLIGGEGRGFTVRQTAESAEAARGRSEAVSAEDRHFGVIEQLAARVVE